MILTIDQGTTSTRALLIASGDDSSKQAPRILGTEQKEFKQIFPEPGWVEHDPIEIWETTLEVCRNLITRLLDEGTIHKDDIQGMAITNQRETTIIWDKTTGKPVHNAIVWQCRRTSEFCSKLRDEKKYPGFNDLVRSKTGLLIDSYFSGPKIAWILRKLKDEGQTNFDNYLFGTIDTWLLWNLTHGASHYTEPSNASRTMIYDIQDDKWDADIIKTLKIPRNLLPEVLPSDSNFGETNAFRDILARNLPIKAMLGDQQAALNGYAGISSKTPTASQHSAKITYGTGTFILIPSDKFTLVDGLVTSVAYKLSDGTKAYAIEGSIFVGGAIVQWLRDGLGFITDSSEIEKLASEAEDNGGVFLVPALAGLGAPFWKEDARGTIFGITRGTTRANIARAALESIAYRVKDVMNCDGFKMEAVNVDGGASRNDMLMQFQSDLLKLDIKRYQEKEMTALGVAKMTGDIDYDLQVETCFQSKADLNGNYKQWQKYISSLL